LLLAESKEKRGFYWAREWDWIIFDEAHRLKNRKTKTSSIVMKLRFKHTLLLTGTPMGNNPSELWALLRILRPERYTSFWRFFYMYVDFTEDFWGGREIVGVRNPHLLRRELASVMLRRRKDEVFQQLPEKIYQTIRVPMAKQQAKYYKQMAEQSVLMLTSGEPLFATTVVAQLIRLRQILSTPVVFNYPDCSSKLDAAVEIIEGADEKVVVFTMFRATVAALKARLDKRKISNVSLIGGMSQEEIEEAKRALNEGDARVLIGTVQAGGVGHSLVGASLAIFIDKHWNPMVQEQAEDRLHRVTQTRTVHIITLVNPSTVDDLVEYALLKKIGMTKLILEEPLLNELVGILQADPEIA